MSYLPLLILELLLFPGPLAYIIVTGSYSIVPVALILCNSTLIWFLQYGSPILNSRINYHTGGYSFPLLIAVTMFMLPYPVTPSVVTGGVFLFILALFMYTIKDPHRISIFNGIVALALILFIIVLLTKLYSLPSDIFRLPLRGVLSWTPYSISLPLLILGAVVLLNIKYGEVALSPLLTHILTITVVLIVIATSGILIPVFPVRRIKSRYSQILTFRLMIYTSLFQLFLSGNHLMILFIGSMVSMIAAIIIKSNGRTLYSDSRFHIIHF